ncbi:MAG: histidine triad protein [Ramlibacter sp.]|nr:histidine triad protein [Ramlibacter sp.]
MQQPGCAFCDGIGGALVFQCAKFRVIRADEAGFPAFYRLVWSEHVREFSDLPQADRYLCTDAITQVEQLLRQHLQPAKVNLASLGNLVPHLHWHIIARFEWDSHFPAPVWAAAQREAGSGELARVESSLAALEKEMTLLLARACGA